MHPRRLKVALSPTREHLSMIELWHTLSAIGSAPAQEHFAKAF